MEYLTLSALTIILMLIAGLGKTFAYLRNIEKQITNDLRHEIADINQLLKEVYSQVIENKANLNNIKEQIDDLKEFREFKNRYKITRYGD